jgi:hypothetical protein
MELNHTHVIFPSNPSSVTPSSNGNHTKKNSVVKMLQKAKLDKFVGDQSSNTNDFLVYASQQAQVARQNPQGLIRGTKHLETNKRANLES